MRLIQKADSQRMRLAQYLVVIICTLLPWSATAVNQGKLSDKLFTGNAGRDLVEKLLVESLMQIAQGKNKQAMETVNELIRTTPNFKLAHLIRGDLLSAQVRALNTFGNPVAANAKSNTKAIEGLRAEARTRLNHYFSTDNKRQVPNISVQMAGPQKHLVLIDTVKSRLFLYKKTDGGLKHVSDHYVSIGKNGADKNVEGDKRTPVGLYFSSKKITTQLSDFYGDGAYPLNYPNELDTHNKKTGYGIWLHGTPKDTYSRPPRASDGCVVLSNPDLQKLAPVLKIGNVPIIISDNVQWVDSNKSLIKSSELTTLNSALKTWQSDWTSQNTDKYLSHYSNSFFYSKGNLTQWAAHKRRVQASKPKVTIQVNDVSMFSYPSLHKNKGKKPSDINQEVIVVNFEQHYESPTLKNKMRKRQYWKNENNQWKIIYEGAA
ncbi:MAG: L,D-transpeptidase family protein [Methylophilaceae bacterium]